MSSECGTYKTVKAWFWPWLSGGTTHSRDLSGRGTARAEDAQGTPTQRHISPSILVYENTTLKVVPSSLGSGSGTRLVEGRTPLPPALRAGSNRLFQALGLYRRSPESGDLLYKSRQEKKAICLPGGRSAICRTPRPSSRAPYLKTTPKQINVWKQKRQILMVSRSRAPCPNTTSSNNSKLRGNGIETNQREAWGVYTRVKACPRSLCTRNILRIAGSNRCRANSAQIRHSQGQFLALA